MFDKLLLWLASGCGSGYLRPAPGTWASAIACLALWLLGNFWQPSIAASVAIALLMLLLGALCAQRAGKIWRQHDDGRIVIDEYLGIWVSLLALPWDATAMLLAFVFFRVFDIWKPFPVRYFDKRWVNGWGVMLDDVVAGVYANISIHALLWGLDWMLMPGIEY